ncbi:MAG: hypothetical protein HY596_04200 [Candidatus Omnitrophica bacterium]|nr:hypothetical protein [Candidatus Omnitrophota bacterium]
MSDRPLVERVRACLQPGAILRFPFRGSGQPHYHVLLLLPTDEERLIFVVASSKVEERKKARDLPNIPTHTLVEINIRDFEWVTKPTIFDCNSPELIHEVQLLECIRPFDEQGKKWEYGTVGNGLLEKLLNGVQDSPVADKRIRAMVRMRPLLKRD